MRTRVLVPLYQHEGDKVMARFSDDDLRRIAADIKKYAQQCTPGAIGALKVLVSMLPSSKEKKNLLKAIDKKHSAENISVLAEKLANAIV